MSLDNRPSIPQKERLQPATIEGQSSTKKGLWLISLALVATAVIYIAVLCVMLLPFIASVIFTELTENPYQYSPTPSWLWRCMSVLCLTHVAYAVYLMLKWPVRNSPPCFLPWTCI
ncbi:hypothetical protein A9975_24995 [Cupriavidus sp. UME77]|nr:hypothetical protein [Cupriavidus sp. UME77]